MAGLSAIFRSDALAGETWHAGHGQIDPTNGRLLRVESPLLDASRRANRTTVTDMVQESRVRTSVINGKTVTVPYKVTIPVTRGVLQELSVSAWDDGKAVFELESIEAWSSDGSGLDAFERPLLTPWQSTDSPLALVFVNGDFDPMQRSPELGSGLFANPFGDDSSDFFGRRVHDRQDDAVFVRKDPATIPESCGGLFLVADNLDLGMVGGKDHVVVERGGLLQHRVSQRDEVHDVAVFVERSFDTRTHAVVVAVDSFTNVTGEGDEVGRGKHELFFRDVNAESRVAHEWLLGWCPRRSKT